MNQTLDLFLHAIIDNILRSNSLANGRLQWERLLLLGHIFENRIPAVLEWLRGFPCMFRVSQPESQQMAPKQSDSQLWEFRKRKNKRGKDILFPRFISKSITCVEDAEVIHILNIAFLEIQSGTVLFR